MCQRKQVNGQKKKPNLKSCYGQLIMPGTEFKGDLITEIKRSQAEKTQSFVTKDATENC